MGKMIQIDGKKLEKILRERKLKRSVISVEMGMSDALLSHNIIRNQISTSTAKMLEAMYGIMLSDYKYVEPPKPQQTEPPVVEEKPATLPMATLDLNELQQAVALAISTMKAPEVDYSKIRDAVCEGLLDAMYQAINNSEQRNMITGLLSHSVKVGMALNIEEMRKRGAVKS